MLATRHEEYNDNAKLPFVLHIDLERDCYKNSKEKNWHKDIEIQVCTKGSGTVLINGEAYSFCENDIAVINSELMHHTGTDKNLTYTCLIVSADFCLRLGIEYNELVFEPIIKNSKIVSLIDELKTVYLSEEENFKAFKCNSIIVEIFKELLLFHSAQSSVKIATNKSFEKVKEAINYIKENYQNKITLDELSDFVHIDKFTLCHNFKKATGQTVVQYINNYRCQKSVGFIEKGYSVAEASLRCGFENPSFFTKTFKKYMGVLPSKYQ